MNIEEARSVFKPLTDKWHDVEIIIGESGEPRLYDPLINLNFSIEAILDVFTLERCIEEMDSMIRNGREYMNIKFPSEGNILDLVI